MIASREVNGNLCLADTSQPMENKYLSLLVPQAGQEALLKGFRVKWPIDEVF